MTSVQLFEILIIGATIDGQEGDSLEQFIERAKKELTPQRQKEVAEQRGGHHQPDGYEFEVTLKTAAGQKTGKGTTSEAAIAAATEFGKLSYHVAGSQMTYREAFTIGYCLETVSAEEPTESACLEQLARAETELKARIGERMGRSPDSVEYKVTLYSGKFFNKKARNGVLREKVSNTSFDDAKGVFFELTPRQKKKIHSPLFSAKHTFRVYNRAPQPTVPSEVENGIIKRYEPAIAAPHVIVPRKSVVVPASVGAGRTYAGSTGASYSPSNQTITDLA